MVFRECWTEGDHVFLEIKNMNQKKRRIKLVVFYIRFFLSFYISFFLSFTTYDTYIHAKEKERKKRQHTARNSF